MGFGMLLGNYFFIQGKGMNLPQLPFYIALGLVVPALLVILFLVHEPEERVGMLKSVGIS